MDKYWIDLADVLQNWATVGGIVVGGAWALYRFGLQREAQAALGIDLAYNSVPYQQGTHLVCLDVTLTNKGAVTLRAKRKIVLAFEDDFEKLRYSGDLLLRAIPNNVTAGGQVRWFRDSNSTSPVEGDIEADLLDEYGLPGGAADFWMEPRESYHVGTALVLDSGKYLAMITFVGDRSDEEFWRRVFLVQVPGASS